jgi:hypothetical protein
MDRQLVVASTALTHQRTVLLERKREYDRLVNEWQPEGDL